MKKNKSDLPKPSGAKPNAVSPPTPPHPDGAPYWDPIAERLCCFLLVDDGVIRDLGLSSRAGPAFVRAFIVQNRSTGEMAMKFRFRYIDPDERSWHLVKAHKPRQEAVEYFENAMRLVLDESARLMGRSLPDGAVQSYYPPEDGGDGMRTLIWLEERALITIDVAEHLKGAGEKKEGVSGKERSSVPDDSSTKTNRPIPE